MLIVGVDEAGRGPLAGPVAVGTVAVTEGFDLLAVFDGLNDSKKVSEKKRERIFKMLEEFSARGEIYFHVELIPSTFIDEKGIVPAVRLGVERGVRKLLPNPADGKVFLDGSLSAPKEYSQETIIGGDAIVPAIMIASIAAKVTRDRYMVAIANTFPHYAFDVHKGYGTKAHFAALDEYGMCDEHRRSFLKNWLVRNK
jgi:ribonuclease HII